ncbi:MAG TPA: L,D-transpeptidase [Candidatus Acidoferrales bacterium]|nr:L,D-transpeptidase [Candidatus Acidoferrales bacterium]
MMALLFTSGCACLHGQRHLPTACLATCGKLDIAPTHYVLTVNIARQTASLYERNRLVKTYVCSTSRFGIGEVEGSMRTPRGLHRIVEKVGDGEPAGTIYREREVIGTVAERGIKAGSITTRILWLEGLEPGYNQGGNVDTHERTIYIHGTGDQASLGQPASHGCIHLADPDLISLFDLLPSGTLVWIAEK